MKTLCFALGLLLLTVCCCNANMRTQNMLAACCSTFTTVRVPPKLIFDITKTGSACAKKAFIVETVRWRKICYSQTFQWAVDVYNELHNTEDSGHWL